MALSISRPDPTSPASVAEASFATARRGFDQAEVRDLLRAVAAELGRLQERERFLERELRNAQSAAPATAPELDDDTVTRLLGEETLRVLQTARESASQIRIKAEEGAARILREATEEAQRIRSEAEIEAARRRSDAAADAEAEVSLAKQQGREMVNEARAYRERVLSELARRREVARQQIEQLIHGRDRLLQVFERARLVAVDVVSELTPLGEPDEYVDLSPTTGPVPMMVPATPRPPATIDTATIDTVDPDEVALPEPVAEAAEVAVIDTEPEPEIEPAADTATDAAIDTAVDTEIEPQADTAADVDVDVDVEAEAEPEPEIEPEIEPEPHADHAAQDAPAPPADNVVALFARLRAGSGDTVEPAAEPIPDASVEPTEAADRDDDADDDADDVADDADDETVSPFARRDADLVPLIVTAARKLKRVLADEQNDVLDTLRRAEPVRDLAAVLPGVDDHGARYADAVGDELVAAAAAGAAQVTTDDVRRRFEMPGALDGVRAALRSELVVPLRDRLERAVADGAGDNDDVARRIRAVYREWKTQRIDDQLDDLFRLAHGTGVLAGVAPGTPMCWLVDPAGPACPDAEDNALAGAVPAGDPYPTGHTVAPAHAGCRCVLAPTDR